ncbi:MAG: hypothetical protein HZA47_01845 [Planctomycetes bacterium]|uniref:hypothetical protein n=1 Tax=Candidatus Wunengus sp. YC65 TaxID=3367701 RepID=UPI001DA8F672|nr:hypothetical protein [Planctomycetota bacterium]
MLIPIVIAGLVIEVICIRIASLGDIMQHIPRFSLMYSAAFVAYLFAVFLVSKNAALSGKGSNISKNIIWIILVFSLVFRLTLLPATPSNDIFRYLWEGKIQLHGINPYSQPPASLNLEHLRDNFFSGISHKHLTTIYPPLTLMVFAIADFISHSFVSIKSAFLLFDILSILVLIKYLKVMRKEPAHVLIYAWSPLVLISFAARGHCDSLQIFFVVLALYFYSIRKNAKSVVSISLAMMSKFVSIIIVPFLIPREKPRYLAILFLVMILLYLPYCRAVKGLFSTLFQFGTQYRYNDSIHFLIFYVSLGSPFISKIITSSIFGAVLLYLYKKYLDEAYFNTGLLWEDTILRFAFLAVGTLLILAPTIHPWYLTWIVPFLCFYHNRAWLVLTGTVVFYYFMNYPLFSKLIEYNNEWVWQEVHWLKLPEYLPFYFLLLYGFLRKHLLTEERNHPVLQN